MFTRIRSVIKATILEVVSEPLFFLLTITAVSVLTTASLLHVHQFGEVSRMARDIALSSLLIFGIIFSIFASIRVFRREIESGTLQMALSRPISREVFFISKVTGIFLGYAIFFIIVFLASITTVVGSEVAKIHSEIVVASHVCGSGNENFLPETLWGVSLAVNVSIVVLPLIVGAVLNRFFRFRFTTTAFIIAFFISIAGCLLNILLADHMFHDRMISVYDLVVRLLPVGFLLIIPTSLFVFLAAALSVRLKDNVVASLSSMFFIVFIPALGNYYQTQAIAKGGELSWLYVLNAFFAALPLIVAFLILGTYLIKNKDVG